MQQISVDDRERHYQDPDPVLDNEFDIWKTEEDFVDVDLEQDLTEKSISGPADQRSLYDVSSKCCMKSRA